MYFIGEKIWAKHLKGKFGFIEENKIIKRGDNIVLGLSGGADSVLLFEVLNEMKKEFDLSIVAVHVNHGIRETAVRDEEFVKKICEEKGIEIRVFHIDWVRRRLFR